MFQTLLEVLNRKENVLDLQTFTLFLQKNKNTLIKIGDHIVLPDFPYFSNGRCERSAFRRLCKMHGADMMYSEFISSEGLIRDAIKSRMKLDIFDYERLWNQFFLWR
jgi:hypothetical protein